MKNWLRKILLAAALLLPSAAAAQNVTVIGPVTPGHCTSFFSTTQVQDSGIGCGGGGGGVTSVGLALPASTFTVTGSPVTGAGTLNGIFINQPINVVFAGPATGVPAVPTWRALVANDLAGALASPPPIGTTTPAQGAFAALSATGNLTVAGNTITNITGSTQCVQVSATGILSGAGTLCGAAGGAVSSVSNADGTLTISPTTGAVVASLALGHANTWTAIQTFNNSDIRLLGSSTGFTTFTSANAGASNFTATVPANTGTIAELNLAQTWTAVQTLNSGNLVVAGATSGTLTINCAAVCGANTITFPAGTTNFSATGGASQYLKQTSAGGAITVGTIAAGDITPAGSNSQVQYNSSGAFGASAGFTFDGTSVITLGVAGTSVGGLKLNNVTSGSITLNPATGALGTVTATLPANTGTIAELNLAQTFSAQQTFSSTLVFSGVGAGTQTKCLGLDVSNNVVTNAAACGGGGGTPGGANTNVQFNNSGAFGGDAGFTYAGNGQATLALGTITTNLKALTITGTWNASGVTFDAPLFMNITATAAANGSYYIDLQNGGSTIFGVTKINAAFPVAVNVNGSGIAGGSGQMWLLADVTATNYLANITSARIDLPKASAYGWDSGFQPGISGTMDTALYRQAAGTVGFVRPDSLTSPAAAQVYNTTDTAGGAPTNYERVVADFTTTANVATIGTQAGGTGSNRAVTLTSAIGVSLSLATAKVATFGDGAANTNGWMQWAGEARVTSDFSVTSSIALTNVTGLSVNVQAGRTYNFQTELFVTDAAAGGVQAAIAGTATATAIQYTGYTIADNAIKGKTNATALATAVGSTTTTETAGIIVRITGTITVNAAGTLTVQMAQNTSNATPTIAKRGSYLMVHDMP